MSLLQIMLLSFSLKKHARCNTMETVKSIMAKAIVDKLSMMVLLIYDGF
jgi:hypothetical protein